MNPAAILEVIEVLKGALDAIQNPLKEMTQAIQGVVGQIAPFVQALSPSTMEAFNRAMLDLNATIGVSFQGVVSVMTQVVREIGGVLLPIMQKLEPIFTQAANAVGGVFASAVRLAVAPLEILTPLLDLIVGFFREYAIALEQGLSIFTAFVKVIGDILASLFGTDTSNLKDIFKQLFDVVRQLTRAMITLLATLTTAAGLGDYVAKFADALAAEAKAKESPAGGAKAAANQPQITNISQIARDAQLRAFIATGAPGAKAKTEVEWLKDLATEVKSISTSNKSLKEQLKDWWNNEVLGGTAGLFGKILRFFDSISNNIKAAFEKLPKLPF